MLESFKLLGVDEVSGGGGHPALPRAPLRRRAGGRPAGPGAAGMAGAAAAGTPSSGGDLHDPQPSTSCACATRSSPSPGRCVYLNHAGGPLSRPRRRADGRAGRDRLPRRRPALADRMEEVDRVRGLAARLLGARETREVAFVENTSTALSLVAEGLDWQPGDNVVGTRECPAANSFIVLCYLLGSAALLAATAVKDWLAANKVPGRVRYYGCPAEEGGAAKDFMVRAGAFADTDIAISWHPSAFWGW